MAGSTILSGSSTLMVGSTTNVLYSLPEPTAIEWGINDISSSSSGRTSGPGNTMCKMRTSQKRKLGLTWTNPSLEDASRILSHFNPEYVYVRYLDVMDGEYEVRRFYTGDKSSPFRQIRDTGSGGGTVMSSLTFNIIEV